MIALVAFALIQAAPAQEPAVEDRIAAFLKGDDAARAELVKLGAFAIRPLQLAREKAPGRIDRFVLELKKTAAHPKGTRVAEILDRKLVSPYVKNSIAGVMSILEKAEVPIFYVWADFQDAKKAKVTVWSDDETVGTVLDQVCRLAELDYGVFHNAIVLAKPERLWPSRTPPAVPVLSEEERSRARTLIAQLDAETIESRESATVGLLKWGPAICTLLEPYLDGKDAEIAARCRALMETLKPAPWVGFGPSTSLRGEGSSVVARLRDVRLEFGINAGRSMESLAEYLKQASGVRFSIRADVKNRMLVSWHFRQSLFDQLCLNLQSHNLDFIVEDGQAIIDTRESLEKARTKGK